MMGVTEIRRLIVFFNAQSYANIVVKGGTSTHLSYATFTTWISSGTVYIIHLYSDLGDKSGELYGQHLNRK